MNRQELSEAYVRLIKKRELYKKGTKKGNILILVGGIIFVLGIFQIIPPILETYFEIEFISSSALVFIIGGIILMIGVKIKERNPIKFPIAEEKYLKVYEAMEDIETFQKDRIDSRFDAVEKLSEIEGNIREPDNRGSGLWETLTQETNENARQFKRNLKERLLPSITKGTEEDLKKAFSILEKFAQYLLNPVELELKDLNNSILELSLYPPEKSQFAPFLEHPYIRHTFIFAIFIVCGVFAYYISKYLGASTDSAISNGFYVPITLIAGYMIFMVKKS